MIHAGEGLWLTTVLGDCHEAIYQLLICNIDLVFYYWEWINQNRVQGGALKGYVTVPLCSHSYNGYIIYIIVYIIVYKIVYKYIIYRDILLINKNNLQTKIEVGKIW